MSKLAKLVVFGGNGFLGRRICEAGIRRGMMVTSVSTSGKRPQFDSPVEDEWIKKVSWAKGDVFRPETYKDIIKDATGVVHSIGILLENKNYKKVVRSIDDPMGLISSFFTEPTGNPMRKHAPQAQISSKSSSTGEKPKGKPLTAEEKETEDEEQEDENPVLDVTYDRINRRSALILAQAVTECNSGKPGFVYISADRGFPGIPSGYIKSKRDAEYDLYQMQPAIRPIVLRPGFMYDEMMSNNGLMRNTMKTTMDLAGAVNSKLLVNAFDGVVPRSISTQDVAVSAVDKVMDKKFSGLVLLDQMKGASKRVSQDEKK